MNGGWVEYAFVLVHSLLLGPLSWAPVAARLVLADIDLEEGGVTGDEDGFGMGKPRRPGAGRGFGVRGGGVVVSLSWWARRGRCGCWTRRRWSCCRRARRGGRGRRGC